MLRGRSDRVWKVDSIAYAADSPSLPTLSKQMREPEPVIRVDWFSVQFVEYFPGTLSRNHMLYIEIFIFSFTRLSRLS